MPELPEVEVTARALAQRFDGRQLEQLRVHNFNLRWRVPRNLPGLVAGQRIERIGRRGKYLLWQLPTGVLISHLGMSGSWRIHEAGRIPPLARHDHVELQCDGAVARFNDPRRFGALLWHGGPADAVLDHPLLASLGIEPFDARFGGAFLFEATRGRRGPIKQLLLGGQVVVGVGNIYATESLYAARIHPRTEAGRIGRARYERLAQAVLAVLEKAIEVGGSTLRDFSGTEGVEGQYTQFARAYGRAGLPCPRCGAPIRRIVQGQRATYYCPHCQKK